MTTFRTALKALSHPLSLFCIILLLVNDHILKVVVPSSLTGKLSDFAGLFFFPFLLAGLLGLVGEKFSFRPQRIAMLSFVITAIWFVGIKTTPWLNHLTTDIAEIILGHPTFIVLDPSDLVALIVLPFSWHLWRKVEQDAQRKPWKTVQVFAFGMAVLGTMATSPCMDVPEVQRVDALEDIIYVYFGHYDPPYLSSRDEGRSWQVMDEVPPDVITHFQQPKSFPIQECVPSNPQICYRTTGDTNIQISHDSGKTWEISWRAPIWRTDYYTRLVGIRWCSEFPDFIPNDLIILPKENNHYLVVAALGNQGLLSYYPFKGWEQIAVDEAEPLLSSVPLSELDRLPFITSNELVVWAIMGFVLTVHLNSSLISHLKSNKADQHRVSKSRRWKNTSKFFLAPFILIVLWEVAIMTPLNLFEGIPYLIIIIITALYGGDLVDWLPGYVAILMTLVLIIVFFLYLEKRRRKVITEGFPHLLFTLLD